MSIPLIAKLTTKQIADYVICGLIEDGLLPDDAHNYRVEWLIGSKETWGPAFSGVEIEAEMGP